MRLVLDTDVIVAAMRSDRGASRQLLLAALDRKIVILASVRLMLEYEAVLTRPEQLDMIGLTGGEEFSPAIQVCEPFLRLDCRN